MTVGQAEEGSSRGVEVAEVVRYRRRAQRAEADRDRLAEHVAVLQRAHVEHLASGLGRPQDLFDVGGHQLADFLDVDGDVDPDRVKAAVKALVEARPGLSWWRTHGAATVNGTSFEWSPGPVTRYVDLPVRSSWSQVLNDGDQ